jgi:hypothetical protein
MKIKSGAKLAQQQEALVSLRVAAREHHHPQQEQQQRPGAQPQRQQQQGGIPPLMFCSSVELASMPVGLHGLLCFFWSSPGMLQGLPESNVHGSSCAKPSPAAANYGMNPTQKFNGTTSSTSSNCVCGTCPCCRTM